MNGHITVAALAETLGVNRSQLHKRVRRDGIKTTKVPLSTGGGVQWLTVIPVQYAEMVTRQYEAARANAAAAGKLKGNLRCAK